MAKPIQVKCIDHVSVVVKNLDASKAFYQDAIGMEPVPRPDFDFQGAWYKAGSTLIHLILEHEHSGPAQHSIPDTCRHSRTWHIAFAVDDAHAVYERLLELKIPVVSPPKARPDGACQVFVTDPDGYVIEFCSE